MEQTLGALGASKVGLTLLNPAINALCPGAAFWSGVILKPSQYCGSQTGIFDHRA